MELAEKVSLKAGARSKPIGTLPAVKETQEKDGDTFEIMANVIWAEVGRAIMDELGSKVFSAGKPSEFRKVRPSFCTSSKA